MDIAYEIAEYIEDNFSYTMGTDLFVETMPVGTQSGIFIMRLGGNMNYYLPTTDAVIDVYAKHTSASTAVGNLEAIKNHLHRMIDTETDNAVIYSILALGDIEGIERDSESAKIYKITFEIKYRNKATIS